jgi:hypothetical protein
MPLVKVDNPVDEQDVDINSILVKEDGSLTLEGEIISDFLNEVNFDPIFDDSEVREAGLVAVSGAKVVEQHGEFFEAEDDDENAIEATVEAIDPEDMAELVDLDDLAMMFEYYVENEMPSETLEDKARLATAKAMLDLDEARPKRTFKKKYGKPGYTRAKVNQMLGAMLFKGAINRAAPGSGYDGGDYKKNPPGYGQGTAAGVKKWAKYTGRATGKVKASIKAAAKKAGKKATKVGKAAAPKKGAAAKLKGKKAKKGKKISASEQQKPAKLTEGANLASKMIGKMHESSLAPVEKKPEADDKK